MMAIWLGIAMLALALLFVFGHTYGMAIVLGVAAILCFALAGMRFRTRGIDT